MKKLIASVAFGALSALAGTPGLANDLVDPGMNSVGPNGQLGNTPTPPWTLTAQRGANLNFDDGASSEAFADHDGGGFGLFFKAFIGNPPWDPTAGPVDVHISQSVPGSPGLTYTLTGWWGAEPPFHTPTFVLTHRPRPSIEMAGGSTFHFLLHRTMLFCLSRHTWLSAS